MIERLESRPLLTICCFVIIMLGFTIDVIPVSIMEARNFISAREMITDNHWILTTMNGEARYEKPPLPTWITAFFGILFGMKSVLALRFPAVIMVMVSSITTYYISLQLAQDKNQSLINALVLATSFYVIGITIEAPWDIFTHGFMLLAIYNLFNAFNSGKITPVRSVFICLFIAASVLSKGPISLYALFLPFLLAYAFSFKCSFTSQLYIKSAVVIVFGIAIGGWWYLHVRLSDPEAFAKIAIKETSNWSNYNVRPFYYYWSFFTQSGIWTIPAFISLLYPYMKSRVKNLKAYKFAFFWTIFAVILLTLIPEKKSRYLMPVLIPLALNIGFYLHYLIENFKQLKDKNESFPVYFNFGLIATIAVGFPATAFVLASALKGIALLHFILTCMVLSVIGLFIFFKLKYKDIKTVIYLTFAFMMLIGLLVLPLVKYQIADNYHPISKLRTTNPQDLKLYSLGGVSPEMIWDYGDKMPDLMTNSGIALPVEKKFQLLSNESSLKEYEELLKLYDIEQKEVFDMNVVHTDSKSYKSRLVNNLYVLTLK